MNRKKTLAAALAGFLLGVAASSISTVRADPQHPTLVHVFISPVAMTDAKTGFPKDLPGGKVVGLSCLSQPMDKFPDAAVCYVATTP